MSTLTFTRDAAAEALFVSAVQPSDRPDPSAVREAVCRCLTVSCEADCAAVVAQAYGDHPDDAAARMRWARAAVAIAFDLEADCS